MVRLPAEGAPTHEPTQPPPDHGCAGRGLLKGSRLTMAANNPNDASRRRWRETRRRWRAGLRDTGLLLAQFKWSLTAFVVAVAGGGLLYFFIARAVGEPVPSLAESMYHILGLVFLQPLEPFPQFWGLQLFYFLMPVIGIIILAQGVADFGVLLFNRRRRGKEWEMAVASTFSDHVVLVGLGHLGFRVVRYLHSLGQDVVAIELDPQAHLMDEVRKLGIPVLQEDGTRESALRAAGITRARSLIVCVQNDSLNLQICVRGRELNPNIQVIARIFDEEFAAALEQQFGFRALSATSMAAPVFAAAAAGIDMTRPISVEGQALSLARLPLAPNSRLGGLTVAELEDRYNIGLVLLQRGEVRELHPNSDQILAAGDLLVIMGGPTEIALLTRDNDSRPQAA